MSEYQRYEFMTVDRPLTKDELDAVNRLSSHIEASSTQAIIEYHWGDFKHDPIKVLRNYFDGFLYWANWGSPRLAFRFPHGILSSDLLDGYNFGDEVTFTEYDKYDVLALEFGELEAPDEWIDYDLGSLIAIREELMAGDTRALYVAWLACQRCESGESYRYKDEYRNASGSRRNGPRANNVCKICMDIWKATGDKWISQSNADRPQVIAMRLGYWSICAMSRLSFTKKEIFRRAFGPGFFPPIARQPLSDVCKSAT